MKKILGIATLLLGSLMVQAQSTPVVMNAATDGTTVNTCLGGLFDSGGTAAAAPYSNNESYVVTVCPDVPGDYMTILFTIFNLDCTDNIPGPGSDADNITIYDGNSTAAPTLGTYTCGQLSAGSLFSATNLNPTGCLTIEWNSNANGTGDFNATLSCETPCDPPTSAGEIVNGDAPDSTAVCIGEQVTFQDAGSTPGPSGLFTIQQWVWHWFDGSPDDTLNNPGQVNHTFNQPGQYVVQLETIDDNGCSNTNATDIQVFVATYPTFDPFPLDTVLCDGEQVTLTAQPDAYEVQWSGFPLSVQDDDNCMVDTQIGVAQNTPMTITGYDSNISLNSANPDVFSICLDIEHSFLGDFVLQVQCPTGAIMTLHQQGGGGTNLGDPDQGQIDCADPSTFGNPWNYCFTPTATDTWVDAVANGAAIPNATGGQSLPAGNYAPVDPLGFAALDGCPINGQWTLIFIDNWGGDDGSIPGWSINFDPALNPPVTVFTPDIGSGADSSWWDLTTPGIIANTPDGNSITVQPSPGVYNYTYNVVNNFGCAHDSSVQVTVTANAPIDAGLDTALCNGLAGVVIGPSSVSASCDYTLDLFDSFGDGWNGNTITITVNGVPTNYTINAGSAASFTIPVNHGDVIDLTWNATGSWQSECELTFIDADGNIIHQDGQGGATPSTNTFSFTGDCLGGLTYSWTPAATLNDPTIPNPTASPVGTTTYTVTAFPVGHPDCAVTDDITVSIGGGLDTGTDSTAMFCLADAPADLYGWLGGTPQPGGTWYDAAGAVFPMPLDPATATPGLYEYRKDSAGCSSSSFIDVQIFQTTVTATILESDCQAMNGEVTITVTSGINPVQYSIDGGALQANNVFTGLGGGTLYTFLIEDSLGCQATFDTTVIDINVPTLDLVTPVDATCFGVCDGTVDLQATNVTQFSIDNGVNFQPTGNFTGLCTGTYDVIVDNGFGCTDAGTFTINEPPVLSITSISPDVVLCPGEIATATVTGQNGIGNVEFTWEFNGTVLGTGTPLDITATGAMLVCVTMSDDCPTTDNACFNITEPTPAVPAMGATVVNGCDPLIVKFGNNTNVPLASTTWTFSDGSSITVNGSDSVQHIFNGPGLYDVTMDVTTQDGCFATLTNTNYIEVFELPEANFNYGPIPATIYDSEISFTNYSSDDVTTWNWVFGSGPNPGSSSDENPTVVYPEGIPGEYPFTLTVTNDNGCTDELSAQVSIVNDVVIYAPSVFTPDGDELNQTWYVHISGIDIYDFHLTMFNRWGEPVWESYNQIAGWNGQYGGGGLVQDGTYVWVIEAKDSYNDKKYEFRGHVTVLK